MPLFGRKQHELPSPLGPCCIIFPSRSDTRFWKTSCTEMWTSSIFTVIFICSIIYTCICTVYCNISAIVIVSQPCRDLQYLITHSGIQCASDTPSLSRYSSRLSLRVKCPELRRVSMFSLHTDNCCELLLLPRRSRAKVSRVSLCYLVLRLVLV